MKFQKIILIIVALIATNLSAFEPFTLSFTDRAENNKPNANQTIDVRLTLVNRYTGADIGSPASYVHTATAVKTNAYGMFSVVFEPAAWKSANFETAVFVNGYNNYALCIETKTGGGEYKQIGVLAICNLINNTVVTEAISGPAKSNFKITFNDVNAVAIPSEGASVDVPFAVAGFTSETIVKPIPCDGYTVRITAYDNTTGKGTVQFTRKMGTPSAETELVLIADNGKGKTTLASITITEAYKGLASGLASTSTDYEANRAKLIWIITDEGELPVANDIKTTLVAVYEADVNARRQLELPNATSIGELAFFRCYALSSVTLPAATDIGAWAFQGCSFLTSVSFGSLITSWGTNVFDPFWGGEFTQNITLTFKTGQKTFDGDDTNGWTVSTTTNVTSGTPGTFVGKTFKEIKIQD